MLSPEPDVANVAAERTKRFDKQFASISQVFGQPMEHE